ncbi:hypothetical protein ANCCAN_28309 [Ancylostoma caninum]|uniref:Uncharacterized protein n=1 Tax=Ancylostoma caninum TaxID=29170 RepID=A0A368F1J6_ANCCA|nr:hypothetical protein ANCCAN_28309 [Ancylostoma caninum]
MFNLDGPDDMISYWKGSQKNPTTFSLRNFGGGSFMVWSDFSAGIRLEIAFLSGPMDSMKYHDTLYKHLLSFSTDIVDRRMPSRWLTPKEQSERHGLACSPDLNAVENLSSILARWVYCSHRQFQTMYELKTTIIDAWEDVCT